MPLSWEVRVAWTRRGSARALAVAGRTPAVPPSDRLNCFVCKMFSLMDVFLRHTWWTLLSLLPQMHHLKPLTPNTSRLDARFDNHNKKHMKTHEYTYNWTKTYNQRAKNEARKVNGCFLFLFFDCFFLNTFIFTLVSKWFVSCRVNQKNNPVRVEPLKLNRVEPFRRTIYRADFHWVYQISWAQRLENCPKFLGW